MAQIADRVTERADLYKAGSFFAGRWGEAARHRNNGGKPLRSGTQEYDAGHCRQEREAVGAGAKNPPQGQIPGRGRV